MNSGIGKPAHKTHQLEHHPGIIPVKFGQSPVSGFRGEDVK